MAETVVICFRSWNRGGFCETHYAPTPDVWREIMSLKASGHRVQVLGRVS